MSHQRKKVKIEAEYDDWFSDVIYIGTETGAKSSNQELISPSFANSSCTTKVTHNIIHKYM